MTGWSYFSQFIQGNKVERSFWHYTDNSYSYLVCFCLLIPSFRIYSSSNSLQGNTSAKDFTIKTHQQISIQHKFYFIWCCHRFFWWLDWRPFLSFPVFHISKNGKRSSFFQNEPYGDFNPVDSYCHYCLSGSEYTT